MAHHMDHTEGHGHGSHGEAQCNMNMLFTWNTENLCIVFPQWRITGAMSLLVSLVAVAAMTAGYELVRTMSRRYDLRSQEYTNSLPRQDPDTPPADPPFNESERERSRGWLGKLAPEHEKSAKIVKAGFYAAQVFYSFFIMLLFMTYNGWVMLAVAFGAFIGHLVFGDDSGAKSVACH